MPETTETTAATKRTPQAIATDLAERLSQAESHATPLASATRDALHLEFMQAVCDVIAPAPAPAA